MDRYPRPLPRPQLPPTPESAAEPTFLPHVRAPLPSLTADARGLGTVGAVNGPDDDHDSCEGLNAVGIGLNVLRHTRDALAHLHHLYATSAAAQHAFTRATALMATTVGAGGRVVVTGMGKSGKIGEKMVATCNSLGVRATSLHAADAVHGDLGGIGPVRALHAATAGVYHRLTTQHDAILLISNSARTPELLALVPHLPPSLPLMVMTAALPALPPPSSTSYAPGADAWKVPGWVPPTNPLAAHPLFAHRCDEAYVNLIIPAPIPESETAAFGVPAPITSTSVALALGDALAMAAAEQLHGTARVADVFRRGHPGGWIGMN